MTRQRHRASTVRARTRKDSPAALANDVSALIADAEALLKAGSHMGDESLSALREKLSESLDEARNRLEDAEDSVRDQMSDANDYVHANPWPAMGIAAFIAFVLGILFGTRGHSR